MRPSPRGSVRPGGAGPALAAAVTLLSLRRTAPLPQLSREAAMGGCDPADVAEFLEVIVSALLCAFPDGGEALLQRLGLLALDWQFGGDAR
jgi:hypothetical protein